MRKNETWVIGNNGVDLHVADETMEEVATFFDKRRVKLAAVAPEMLDMLKEVIKDGRLHWTANNKIQALIDRAIKITAQACVAVG